MIKLMLSFPLGWMQKLEIASFPYISGSLAQLVQIDLDAAEVAVLSLLTQPTLASAMDALRVSGHWICLCLDG